MKTGTAILQFVNPPLAGWPNLDVRTGVGRKKRFSRIPQKLFCQPQSLFRLLFARQKSRPCAQAHHACKPQTALSTRRVIRILTTHDHQIEEKRRFSLFRTPLAARFRTALRTFAKNLAEKKNVSCRERKKVWLRAILNFTSKRQKARPYC
ncbi:hypothetical protein [Paraprevotella xylaniphila]|uniref:hypothetical protein n=1 Tax=Paraprevotella xylaniphila TaxID=454155 RepID=UPI003AB2DFB4